MIVFSCLYPDMDDVKDRIECDMDSLEEEDGVVFTITPVWFTDEEFSQLPEAEF